MLYTVVNAFFLPFELRIASVAYDGVVFADLSMGGVVLLLNAFSAVLAVNDPLFALVQMLLHEFSLHRFEAEITLDLHVGTHLHVCLDLVLAQLRSAVPVCDALDKLVVTVQDMSLKLIIVKYCLTAILHVEAHQLQLRQRAPDNLMTLLLHLDVL